ncbi:MAG: hypothetical protein H0T79_15330, partial [Deltaproteobacteria bacterium]|nr:hypothetical protein [Deltaproteobacteria bacterium]
MKPMILAAIASLAAACTTLGPMPTTTAVSAIPSARGGAEVQAGIVPAYYLSDAAQESTSATATGQLAAVVDPAELLGL